MTMSRLEDPEIHFLEFCLDNLVPPEDSILAFDGFREAFRNLLHLNNHDTQKMLRILRNHIAYFYWDMGWKFMDAEAKAEMCNVNGKGCRVKEKYGHICQEGKPTTWVCNNLFKKIFTQF